MGEGQRQPNKMENQVAQALFNSTPQMAKTRILLVDDHDVVRKGLTFLLKRITQTEVVGEATDGHQAVELAEKLAPAVVLMDIAMPVLNGIDAAARILKRHPETAAGRLYAAIEA